MVVATIALLVGGVEPARADLVLEGSIETSTLVSTVNPRCTDACAAFFATGCSEGGVPDGVTTSIVDVGQLGGRSLRFSWTSSGTRSWDAVDHHAPGYGPSARIFFYVVDACEQPTWSSFGMSSKPSERSRAFTIPHGSKWLIAQAAEISTEVEWSAEAAT